MNTLLEVERPVGDSATSWSENADAIHQWYRIIMGFDWKLADFVINELGICEGQTVMDPFAGAGTTLVQCKKRGINTVGMDVNPVCILASKVKTNWTLSPGSLRRYLDRIVETAENDATITAGGNAAFDYLQSSGMIKRGWLSLHKARKVIALRNAIRTLHMPSAYREFFQLALVSALVNRIADVKFGPELYCLTTPRRFPAVGSFVDVAEMMIDDMRYASRLQPAAGIARISKGDSRSFGDLMSAASGGSVDYVITSPPYPNEHDYTRSTRLELVVLDHVNSVAGLQKIKKQMVRCTTKGVYKDDVDAQFASSIASVDAIAKKLDRRAKNYSDGFSRLYGRMVREYFGGMASHLHGIQKVLKPGGRCAYVVRDSQSLLGVYIDTPKILAEIADSLTPGLRFEKMIEWKRIRGTTGVRVLSEKIIMLRKSPE